MSSRVPDAGAASLPRRRPLRTRRTRRWGVHAVCATVSGMRIRGLFLLIVAGCLPGVFAPACGAALGSAESRAAAQNALLEEYYQSELKAHPERATAYGDYRYNDRLDEYSLAALAGQHARDQRFLARLEAITTS